MKPLFSSGHPSLWLRLRAMSRLPRLRSHAMIAAGIATMVALGWGYYIRLDHITETDARVMADMVTISSRIDGWIVQRPVTDGQRIKAGDVLVVIDQREAAQQLEELKARADSIRLDRERAEARMRIVSGTSISAVTAAEAHRTAAIADLAAAHSEMERAAEDFRRTDALLAAQYASRQTWDLHRSQFRRAEETQRAAQAKLVEAEAALTDARTHLGDVGVLQKEIERLTHDAEQVDAQRRQHEISISDRIVRSPVDGIVDQKFVEPGEYVIPGQRLLLLHDPKVVWVEANIKETKLERLRSGQTVSIEVDAYPDRIFNGKIERIGNTTTSQFALLPSPNPSGNFTKITQRVPLRIAVAQPDDAPLRPGMMVEVDIDTSQR
ncbi:HlyD family secretion protein [Magnetospirillum molischianum]|uniref:HlyD family secretion protein n=1 Tax=Magnetospirillum molischianum DSM 120 TaxID=1150626 RepID=H8FV40_MAGML|nr:HlyD family secretion protein [Magnetospirillum molischianum]CCG42228.1 HlyD family secretion protein [Magnetospirillum molischianum DSM 120]